MIDIDKVTDGTSFVKFVRNTLDIGKDNALQDKLRQKLKKFNNFDIEIVLRAEPIVIAQILKNIPQIFLLDNDSNECIFSQEKIKYLESKNYINDMITRLAEGFPNEFRGGLLNGNEIYKIRLLIGLAKALNQPLISYLPDMEDKNFLQAVLISITDMGRGFSQSTTGKYIIKEHTLLVLKELLSPDLGFNLNAKFDAPVLIGINKSHGNKKASISECIQDIISQLDDNSQGKKDLQIALTQKPLSKPKIVQSPNKINDPVQPPPNIIYPIINPDPEVLLNPQTPVKLKKIVNPVNPQTIVKPETPIKITQQQPVKIESLEFTESEKEEINKLWTASIIEIARAAKEETIFDESIGKNLENVTFKDKNQEKKAAIIQAYKSCKETLVGLDIKELTFIESNSKYFKIGGFVTSATTLIFLLAEIQESTKIFGNNNVIAAMFKSLKSLVEKIGSSVSIGKDLSSLGFIGILSGSAIALLTAGYLGSKYLDNKKSICAPAKDIFDKSLGIKKILS